jgi:hypothetical protein
MKIFEKKIGFFDLVIFFLLIYIFNFMTYVCFSDIPLHADILTRYVNNVAPLPSNFLYYFTIYTIGFFTTTKSVLLLVSVYTLAIVTFWKYLLIKKIFFSELKNINKKSIIIVSVTAFMLLFLFALPTLLIFVDYFYLLSFSPTLWHNSTAIFLMPFALLLFWQTVKQLQEFSVKGLIVLSLFLLLNIAAKPSYIFVYAIAYPLILLKKYRFSKLFWLNLIPIILSLIFVFVQYFFIYESTDNEVKSSIKIDLFHLVKLWADSKNILFLIFLLIISIVSSFLFPIVLIFKNQLLIKKDSIQLAILSVFFGIIIGITLYESGPREFDGNFMWQTFIASFILFFICTLELLKLVLNEIDGWKKHRLEIALFLIQFLSGIYYLSRIFLDLNYA